MIEQHLLLALAEADLHADKARRGLDKVLARVPDAQAALRAAEAALGAERAALAEVQANEKEAAREEQLYVKRRATAVRALENGLGDPASAERQLAQCDTIIGDLETKQLELMDDAETVQERITKGEQAVKAANAVLDLARQQEGGQASRERASIRTYTDERTLLYAQLDRELQNRYDVLRDKRGTAVSRMVEGYCRACRHKVAMSEAADLRRGLLKSCRSCARYLALDPK